MYAVVAPGFSNVYTNWHDVERIKKLYPYPKWVKVQTEEEAYKWIRRNEYSYKLFDVYHYGDTFKDLYIDVKYKIFDDSVFYALDCSRVGMLRFKAKGFLVEYKGKIAYAKMPNVKLSNESIASHMSAIYNLFVLVGNYLDVNIHIDYYSLFYAIVNYTGNKCRPVILVQEEIAKRLGGVALTLRTSNREEVTNCSS